MKTTQKKLILIMVLSLVLLLAVTACGPREKVDPNLAITQVVETAMAAITQTAAALPPTATFTATLPPTSTPTFTPEPSPTTAGLPTATQSFNQPTNQTSSCDVGSFVKDVTIPDGTVIAAGSTFTKTWEIKNVGTCTWDPAYTVVFFGGEQMAAQANYTFTTENIEPGESVEISVEMTAPSKTGTFTGYWILRNALGQNFLVDGGSFYVEIVVGGTSTPGPSNTPEPSPTPTE
jgi:hypothetical protein